MTLKNTIYADYQATTPVDPRVLEKMLPYWGESFGNPTPTTTSWGGRRQRRSGNLKPPLPP